MITQRSSYSATKVGIKFEGNNHATRFHITAIKREPLTETKKETNNCFEIVNQKSSSIGFFLFRFLLQCQMPHFSTNYWYLAHCSVKMPLNATQFSRSRTFLTHKWYRAIWRYISHWSYSFWADGKRFSQAIVFRRPIVKFTFCYASVTCFHSVENRPKWSNILVYMYSLLFSFFDCIIFEKPAEI